ncbi:BnaA01g12600D [Brassica napus]|uniref:BnaA01g12600D protein n=1 Tax=Brassica napus TaxID=3708 RepID=A0A078HV93_BRANA|nr:BnaA01g12600D [Brassica napus]
MAQIVVKKEKEKRAAADHANTNMHG